MQGIGRLALVGIMRAWIGFVRQGSELIPRPTGLPGAHSPGMDSDRVLILGGGPASGWGVTSHDLALPGALARALSARTGRGADVNLLADPFGFLDQLPNLLIDTDLSRINAVVLFIGVNDAVNLTSEKSWEQNMGRLLRDLERQTPSSTYLYVMEIQPIRTVPVFDTALGSIADRHARRLTARTERICRAVPRVIYLPLTDNEFMVAGRYRNSSDYRLWAEFLAIEMAERLNQGKDTGGSSDLSLATIAVPRSAATVGEQPPARDGRLEHILALAQQSFGTESAAFVVRDDARLRVESSGGPTDDNLAWADSISSMAARQPGALVIGDTLADERFRHKSYVTGAPFLRFYAGFPIESPSGERIGAVCVFDPKPRNRADVDAVLLRELALMVQDELHASGEASVTRA